MTPFKCDTPGFELSEAPKIRKARGRYNELLLERNDTRAVQTSMYQAQIWRANVDCQIIILDATSECIDMEEFRRVCEYVVAYTTKATEREQDTMQSVHDLILNMKSQFNDKSEVTKAARKVLNMFTASKTISKQEAMVLMAKLKLYSCSETISPVSTRKTVEIVQDDSINYNRKNDLLTRYENRDPQHWNMCLHDYFDYIKNINPDRSSPKYVVPHYIYGGCQVRFLLNEGAAEHLYKIFVPWKPTDNMELNFVRAIEKLVHN